MHVRTRPPTPEVKSRKRSFWQIAGCLLFLSAAICGALKIPEYIRAYNMLVKCQDIRDIAGAEMSFREKFNFFPGDLKNASKLIKKCGDCEPPASSAGDGIVGDKNFSLGEKIKFEENNPSFESIFTGGNYTGRVF